MFEENEPPVEIVSLLSLNMNVGRRSEEVSLEKQKSVLQSIELSVVRTSGDDDISGGADPSESSGTLTLEIKGLPLEISSDTASRLLLL